MRVLVLVEALGQGEPDAWVETLSSIVHRAQRANDADTLVAVECIRQAAANPALPYATRQALYEAAVARGLPTVSRLFFAASPTVVSATVIQKQLAPERPLEPRGRPLTLGERKALARTHRRDQLSLLLRDPHPAVVAILLDNPHITEPDVVRIAAGRQAVPASLATIAAHPRWSVRHAVKRALVLNPTTPLADAIRIATTLRAQELVEIARDPRLAELLRHHAAELHAASSRARDDLDAN